MAPLARIEHRSGRRFRQRSRHADGHDRSYDLFPGSDRPHRNYWEATNGQLKIAKLSDITGGESYFLGLQTPVSFKPYLDICKRRSTTIICWAFTPSQNRKAGCKSISLSTEVNGVEFGSADAVWVPAEKK